MPPITVSQESITRPNSGVLALSANVPPVMPANLPPAMSSSSPVSKNARRSSVSGVSRQSSQGTSSKESKSSLGIQISDSKKKSVNIVFRKHARWRLESGRYVEDGMLELVKTLKYEQKVDSFDSKSIIETNFNSPAMYCILDVADDNSIAFFSKEEFAELEQHAKAAIQYPALPLEMQQSLRDIPDTDNLETIYTHLGAQQLNYATQSSLIWLKFSLQSALLLFKNTFQNERDICANVWGFITRVFDDSLLTCRIEKASTTSQQCNSKKRKMSTDSLMVRQQNPYGASRFK